MKKLKKILALLLCAAMMAGSFACSNVRDVDISDMVDDDDRDEDDERETTKSKDKEKETTKSKDKEKETTSETTVPPDTTPAPSTPSGGAAVEVTTPTFTDPDEPIGTLNEEVKTAIMTLLGYLEAVYYYGGAITSCVAQYEAYIDYGDLEDFGGYVGGTEAVVEELNAIESSINAYCKEIKNIRNNDVQNLGTALKKYTADVKEVYADLYEISDFYYRFLTMVDELTFDDTLETLDYCEQGYYAYDDFGAALEAMACPKYFQHELNNVIDAVYQYRELMYTYYLAYGYGDPLRLESANYFVEIVDENLDKSLNDMVSNTESQMEAIYEVEPSIETLYEEISGNGNALLAGNVVDEYSYLTEKKVVNVEYTYEDEIYPALYNSMDAIVTLKANCPQEDCEVLVSVEIEGFTQKFEQKYTLDDRRTVIDIKPMITTADVDLSSMKERQLVVTVTDIETNKIYLKETKVVKIMSLYDWPSYDDEGNEAYYTILAWLEPESETIKALKRYAAEIVQLVDYSGMGSDSLVGYAADPETLDDAFWIVAEQVAAIQLAMSDIGVKYNNSSFSLSESNNYIQRVTTPTETIESLSGICIDLSLVMASALQAADMNAMLVITPGHAQVAVELFETGEYVLIETTNITTTIPREYEIGEEGEYLILEDMMAYYSPELWANFIENNKAEGYCYMIECDMAGVMGYRAFNN